MDEDVTAYAPGHIPGAVRWSWHTDLRAFAVGRDFIDQQGLTSLLQAAGVHADTTVVLYAGNNNWFAAYAYWLLRYLGFDAVKLLNGGRKKWELRHALTDDVPTYARDRLAQHAGPQRTQAFATRCWLGLAHLRSSTSARPRNQGWRLATRPPAPGAIPGPRPHPRGPHPLDRYF